MHSNRSLPKPVGYQNLATIRAQRRKMLQDQGFAGYADYLLSEAWQKVRTAYYLHPETVKECVCGEDDWLRLYLHHLTYERVGKEDVFDLRPLCARCHRDVHLAAERGFASYDLSDYVDADRARKYADERNADRKRRGESTTENPYNKENWDREAELRRHWAQDRRKAAKELVQRINALR